jgi:hypothetical protein
MSHCGRRAPDDCRLATIGRVGHGRPSRVRCRHGRCTSDSGQLVALIKSAASGQNRLCAPAPHFGSQVQGSPLGRPVKPLCRGTRSQLDGGGRRHLCRCPFEGRNALRRLRFVGKAARRNGRLSLRFLANIALHESGIGPPRRSLHCRALRRGRALPRS